MGKHLNILFFITVILVCACDPDNPVETDEPTNIVVEIDHSEDEPGKIIIQAEAENVVRYAFYTGSTPNLEEENQTGNFEYTFSQTGNYQIEVRAYGASGKYIKATRIVEITISNPVVINDGYQSPIEYDGYDLVWRDEFNGSEINSNNWVFETGNGCPNLCGWGNNELEYYREENAWLEDGVLVIEAREESVQGSNYTSTRMKTEGKQSFRYGRIDIRALLPKGQGIWPALWMLGNNITSVGWPACGEIDIMEMIGGDDTDNEVHGTLHWDNNGHVYTGGSYRLSNGIFADEYHVFSIEWDDNSIKWFLNNNQYHEISISGTDMSEFHEEFFFIFNVAVGGNWPGSPDNTIVFPQRMKVDYIRVFQKN